MDNDLLSIVNRPWSIVHYSAVIVVRTPAQKEATKWRIGPIYEIWRTSLQINWQPLIVSPSAKHSAVSIESSTKEELFLILRK